MGEKKTIPSMGFFSDMPEPLLNELKGIAREKIFQKGEMIFYEGDESIGFYLLLTGLVKIYKLSSDGKEQILQFIRPNETFGEVVVFSGKAFPAHAEAAQKSRVLLFPKKDFLEIIRKNPDVALTMLAILSERLRNFTVQVENLSLKEVPNRLASYFLYLSKEEKEGALITLDISKGQLASLLGTIPETLSRVLAKMKEREIIEVEGNRIRLVDISRLKSMNLFMIEIHHNLPYKA